MAYKDEQKELRKPDELQKLGAEAMPFLEKHGRQVVLGVSGVLAVEKLSARKAGLVYYVDIHVQADPQMSLRNAHELSGAVKSAIRTNVPRVFGVLVHMEPFEQRLD